MAHPPIRSARSALAPLAALALCASLLVGCASVAAQGSLAPEDAVRASVEAEFSRLKDGESGADALLGDAAGDLGKVGVSADDFLSAALDGSSIEVEGVDFGDSGDAATAHAKLTRKALDAAFEVMGETYTQRNLSEGGEPTEEELFGRAGTALVDSLRATQPSETSVDLALERRDGSWFLTDEAQAALAAAFVNS